MSSGGQEFQQTINVAGVLAADVQHVFAAHADCTLKHVSVVGSNAHNATVKIGTVADDDLYLAAKDIGDSNVPNTYGYDDFVDSDEKGFPRIRRGGDVKVSVDFDGAAGTAIQNLSIVLTFAAG